MATLWKYRRKPGGWITHVDTGRSDKTTAVRKKESLAQNKTSSHEVHVKSPEQEYGDGELDGQ